MDLRSKNRKSSLKTNNIDNELNGKHIKFNDNVVVEKQNEPLHLDESHHKFKEAETHYQDIVY
jgi:hypothetical protein